jgi:hypothetical protein
MQGCRLELLAPCSVRSQMKRRMQMITTQSSNNFFALVLLIAPLGIIAQTVPSEVFEKLANASDLELKEKFSDKIYRWDSIDGSQRIFHFKPDGYVYINGKTPNGSAFNSSRPWKLMDGKLCIEQSGQASCSEIRIDGANMVAKTDVGTLQRLIRQ